MKGYEIIHLAKEEWKGTIIPMRYTTSEYYDVQISEEADGYGITLIRRKFDEPVSHYPEEYDYSDRLYQDFWEKAYAWGIVEETGGQKKLLACIETCPEEWSNRLMVTELWVCEELRRQGIGHALMAIAKQQAILEHRRAIILETQSCNMAAISFYKKEGFQLIGLDTCCYSNRDIERKEVRVNMGYFWRRTENLSKMDIVVRKETAADYHKTEEMTLRAFWNKHQPGCNEHLLVHKMRGSDVYLPEVSRVAAVGEEIVGAIFYAKAWLKNGDKVKEIAMFGPLCVAPQWQGCGVGKLLLEETLPLVKAAGYDSVVIFGEPGYYPLRGFQTCDVFGVTTADGKNFDAFMGIELVEGALKDFGGRFCEPEVFENLPEDENERFTKEFNAPGKQEFPCQW